MGATNVFTKTLSSASLTIQPTDYVQRISIICRQGSITVIGSSRFQDMDSEEITLEENQGITLSASSTSNPVSGITITSASGTDIAELVISTS
jgi:hypothetical protein